MKKTVFLKNGPSHNLPKTKYVISEPHGDLLQWNLSWALTFDFLVHQEGGVASYLCSVTQGQQMDRNSLLDKSQT